MKVKRFSDFGVSCLHPVHLYNKYVGDYVTVPCRKCAACRAARANGLISRLETLRSKCEYAVFFTLTYDNAHVPTALIFDNSSRVEWYSLKEKCRMTYTVRHRGLYDRLDDLDYEVLCKGAPATRKSKGFPSHVFPVLQKEDVQLFFKRFRKLFNYAFPEKTFKYFVCGEYGSKSFRPHYHGILYLFDSLPFRRIQDFISMSWKFGLIDVQVVSSTASSYCAAYTCADGSIPYFLQNIKAFAPFHTQSNGTCFEIAPQEEVSSFQQEYKRLFGVRLAQSDGGPVNVPFSKSVRLRFYPQYSGFYKDSDREKLRKLLLYAHAVEEQKTLNPVFALYLKDDCGHVVKCDVPYRFIYQLREKFSNKGKQTDYFLDNQTFSILYTSKRVYDIAKKCGFRPEYVAKCVICFYTGAYAQDVRPAGFELPDDMSSNFQLSLLKSQYSAFELCETDRDVQFLYSFYNGSSLQNVMAVIDDMEALAFQPFVLDDVESYLRPNRDLLECYSKVQHIDTIKHKDRNDYYRLRSTYNKLKKNKKL